MAYYYLVSYGPSATGPWTLYDQVSNVSTSSSGSSLTLSWTAAPTVSSTSDVVNGLVAGTSYWFQIIPVDSTTGAVGPATVTGPITTQSAVTLTPSPNDTVISSPGGTGGGTGQIVDSNLVIWTLVPSSGAGTQIKHGSYVDGANVTTLLYHNNLVYQSNTAGGWWYWDNPSNSYIQVSGDPRIASGPSGPTPVFADDFTSLDTTNLLGSSGKWRLGGRSYATAGYADTDSLCWNVNPQNSATPITSIASVRNSILTMTIQNTPSQYAAACNNLPYVSAWMDTRDLWYQENGYFEAKIAVKTVPGTICSFWLQPQSGTWPPEIDVLEANYTPVANGGLVALSNVFSVNPPQGLSNWYLYSGTTDLTQYHLYGVDWQKDYCTFYVDRVQTNQIATPAGYAGQPMYMILSMGATANDSYTGPIDPSTLPCSMLVDYVQVWQVKPF